MTDDPAVVAAYDGEYGEYKKRLYYWQLEFGGMTPVIWELSLAPRHEVVCHLVNRNRLSTLCDVMLSAAGRAWRFGWLGGMPHLGVLCEECRHAAEIAAPEDYWRQENEKPLTDEQIAWLREQAEKILAARRAEYAKVMAEHRAWKEQQTPGGE